MSLNLSENGADVWSGIYDVINKSDFELGLEVTALQGINAAPIILNKMENGVDYMVDRLRRRVDASGTIDLLRIHGHGGAGIQTVSWTKDLRGHNLTQSRAIISYYNLSNIKASLSRLQGYFAPNAQVWLMGCEVGAQFQGRALTARLAKLWGGVTVVAGIPIQQGGGAKTFSLEGSTVTAYS
jgi:hypothetical protein